MSNLTYIGTRDNNITATASQAILRGICPDGGLFVPSAIPKLDKTLEELANLSYQDLAYEILKLYLDFTEDELRHCINSAYDSKFDDAQIAPVVKQGDALFLELFHGRTLAFKDIALSILPYLMKTAAKREKLDKELIILTATSGDTGKAAMEGFANVEGTKIIVFFPEDGVSPVQRLQMTTQEGDNTCVVGIKGNFDDAQSAVKSIFTDNALRDELDKNGYVFSSANSINIGRLVPQIVYYFYTYFKAVKMGEIKMGDKLNFTVPTGNFGNILAGYYAMNMGLPIGHLLCASNSNKVLTDFFETKTYNKNREFFVTNSPSMDILISSNLERLLFHTLGSEKTKENMTNLNTNGSYSVDTIEPNMSGQHSSEDETAKAIKTLYDNSGYVMDTHTAVAYDGFQKYKAKTGDTTPMVIVATASPFKFTKDVMIALDEKYKTGDAFELMNDLENIAKVKIPQVIADINSRPILHDNVCEKDKIKEFVKDYLIK